MMNTPEQQTVYTLRSSWGALLRGKAGYLISDPRDITRFYAERPAPGLFALPLFIILLLVLNQNSEIIKHWSSLIFPLVVIAIIFAGTRKTALTFYENRNRHVPLFRAIPQKKILSFWNRFTLIDSRSGEEFGGILMNNKTGRFLPSWDANSATGELVLRALVVAFSLSLDRYRLLAGQEDEVVGYISSNFLQSRYSFRFSGREPEGIDGRLIMAFLTVIFDNKRSNNI